MAGRKKGTYSQTVRALHLLERLAGRRNGIPLATLVDELGVTPRQVRRDLDALEQAGNDVERFARGGETLVRLVSARASTVAVTRRERYTLLAIRRVFDVLRGTPFFEDVESIFDKLTDGLSPAERAELARLGDRIAYLPDGGRKRYTGKEEVLDALQTGVLDRRLVRFRYRAATSGRTSTGVLAPFVMVLYRNGLYVVGQRLGDDVPAPLPSPLPESLPLVYAVERFSSVEALRAHRFEAPTDLCLADLFDGAFGVFLSGSRAPQHVVIDFSAQLAGHVSARSWHRTQVLSRRPGGGVRLEMDVSDTTEVTTWALSFGPHARVVEPPALAERVRAERLAAVSDEHPAGL